LNTTFTSTADSFPLAVVVQAISPEIVQLRVILSSVASPRITASLGSLASSLIRTVGRGYTIRASCMIPSCSFSWQYPPRCYPSCSQAKEFFPISPFTLSSDIASFNFFLLRCTGGSPQLLKCIVPLLYDPALEIFSVMLELK